MHVWYIIVSCINWKPFTCIKLLFFVSISTEADILEEHLNAGLEWTTQFASESDILD